MPVKAEPSIAPSFPLLSSCGMLLADVPTLRAAAVPNDGVPVTSLYAPLEATACSPVTSDTAIAPSARTAPPDIMFAKSLAFVMCYPFTNSLVAESANPASTDGTAAVPPIVPSVCTYCFAPIVILDWASSIAPIV